MEPPNQQQQRQQQQQQRLLLQPPSRRRPPANRTASMAAAAAATASVRSSSPDSECGSTPGKPPSQLRNSSPAYASVHRARLPSPGLALQREQQHQQKRLFYQQQLQQQQHHQQQQHQLYGYQQIAEPQRTAAAAHQPHTNGGRPPANTYTTVTPHAAVPYGRMPMAVQIPQPHHHQYGHQQQQQHPQQQRTPRPQQPIPGFSAAHPQQQQQQQQQQSHQYQALQYQQKLPQPSALPQRQASPQQMIATQPSQLPQFNQQHHPPNHPHHLQNQPNGEQHQSNKLQHQRPPLPLPPPPTFALPPPPPPLTSASTAAAPPMGRFPGSPQYHQRQQQQQQQHQHPHQSQHHYQQNAAQVAVLNHPAPPPSTTSHMSVIAHSSNTGVGTANAGNAQPAAAVVAPQFHNISKTATNLLNEIYEKHLLAQTRFEADGGNGNIAGPCGANTTAAAADVLSTMSMVAAGGDFNFHSLSQQQQRQLLQRQQRWLQNAPPQQSSPSTATTSTTPAAASNAVGANGSGSGGGGVEIMIKNNDRQRVPRKISETATLKIQRSLNEKQLELAAAANGSLGKAASAEANARIISGRSEPLGGNVYLPTHVEGHATEYGESMGMGMGSEEAAAAAAVADHPAAFGVHRNSKINIMLETAQAMAAAAYFARAAQRMSSNNATASSRVPEMSSSERGGFCGALQRAPPPMPAGLARRLANRDNFGVGKVKVMLRISDNAPTTTTATNSDPSQPAPAHYMCADKKKRQVTLTDPATLQQPATDQERGPMVAAPKMFAFDGLFTGDDTQADVCSSALSEVIPVVLEGSDACLMTLGYPTAGQSRTMFGSVTAAGGADLGAIPCAIAWLYKGIAERKQTTGSRFSVRVSAIGVSATKSGSKDLLAAHKTESDESPSSYLRDDYLGGPTELQAPTAERAALYLDAALAERSGGGASGSSSGLDPTLIFTLHVYQYSLERRQAGQASGQHGGRDAGIVKGGRSRLHLIDLGGCANRSGGLPLSGIGNVLLAILSGQRHPPNRDHALTPLLKDCLAPLSCHVSVLAHVAHTQTHTDALTTIQLASRIHRMRRRKHRYPLPSDKQLGVSNTGNQSGSSEGPDPSSSDLSADTVIYMGPSDDATDGEHPPVYLPSMFSGDNRCSMNKALKGSAAEKPTRLPQRRAATTHKPQSPVPIHRTDSLKRQPTNSNHPHIASTSAVANTPTASPQKSLGQIAVAAAAAGIHYPYISPVVQAQVQAAAAAAAAAHAAAHSHPGSPAKQSTAGGIQQPYRHVASNVPTPKGSPMRRAAAAAAAAQGSPKRQPTGEEQWVDGPRLSKSKVAEARHLLREINHVKQKEQWIDGPKIQPSPAKSAGAAGSATTAALLVGALPGSNTNTTGYGYMDSHKKIMIRQWVENQTSQIFQPGGGSGQPISVANAVAMEQAALQLQQQQQQHQQQQQQQSATQFSGSPARHQTMGQFKAGQFPSVDDGDQHSLASSSHHTGELLLMQHNKQQQQHHHHQQQQQQHNQPSQSQTQSPVAGFGSRLGLMQSPQHQPHATSVALQADQVSAAGSSHRHHDSQEEEDQDSGPSEVPPALPLIEPLSSREISHDSIHRMCSRHVSRESLSQLHIQTKDCGLQVTEDDIVRAMGDHPLSALSHGNMSAVSSFHHSARDAVSECLNGDRTKNQFDQLARLRELYTSQLAMAEVVPVPFRLNDACSVFSEPAYRFIAGTGSVCSEPAYRVPSPRCSECRQSIGLLSRSPSQISLPSLDGIVAIADMQQYASLRHPDGASDPNLQQAGKDAETGVGQEIGSGAGSRFGVSDAHTAASGDDEQQNGAFGSKLGDVSGSTALITQQPMSGACSGAQRKLSESSGGSHVALLQPLALGATGGTGTVHEAAYDSGHDSSTTPRTSKHSGISRRAESGYHSVATVRDSDESSFGSAAYRGGGGHHGGGGGGSGGGRSGNAAQRITAKKQRNGGNGRGSRQDRSLCNWLRNPFTCTYPDTEGEISDF